MDFAWDPEKAASNLEKHGLSFEEASTAFGDPLSRTIPDRLHSDDEDRFVLIGSTSAGRLAVVVHTDRGATVRLISARRLHLQRNGAGMSKPPQSDPDLLNEYDFSKGEVGRYAKRYAEGTNVVVLDPDVAAVFKTAESVNRVLREHLKKTAGRGA